MQPIEITDHEIQNLQTPAVDGWSVSKNRQLNLEHQSLLRMAREYPVGVEVAVCYERFPFGKVVTVGRRGHVRPDFSVGEVYMHNHPSGYTFSLDDVEHLLFYENMELLTAVGNNGAVYVLRKTDDFDFTRFYHAYQKAAQQEPSFEESPRSYIDFVERLLYEAAAYGLEYVKEVP
jgi:hypothetical protein